VILITLRYLILAYFWTKINIWILSLLSISSKADLF